MEIYPFTITDNVINAFNKGFSDYVVKIPYMNKETFVQKMIINNCNSESYSSLCVHNGEVVGVCLCGIDSSHIMINTLCIIPEYRGTVAATMLMKETMKKAGNKSIILEVIDKNIRAINFYKKFNFKKNNDITYMNGKIPYYYKNVVNIREMTFLDFVEIQNIIDVPINWQNKITCLLRQNIKIKGYYENEDLLGFICYTESNYVSIKQIYVKQQYRHRKIATKLLESVCKARLTNTMFIENGSGEKFYKNLGLNENIHLYEMLLNG